MKIDSIITEKKSRKKSKQVKASDKAPKLIKPNTGHESPHPLQGKMVGEMYDEPVKTATAQLNKNKKAYFNMQMLIKYAVEMNFTQLNDLKKPENLDKVIATMQQDGIDVMENKLGALVGESELDMMEPEDRMLANDLHSMMKDVGPEKFIGFLFGAMTNPKYKNLSLEKFADQIKNIYTQSREPFKYTSQDTPGGIDKGMRRLAVNKQGKLDYTEGKTNEAYSGTKSALVSAVMTDLEKKANDEEGVEFLRRLASLIGKKIIKRDNGSLMLENKIPFTQCPKCGGSIVHESQLNEKQDACYHKVKSRYKVWPSAYASGALVKCRKVGAKNWGNKSKKKKSKK